MIRCKKYGISYKGTFLLTYHQIEKGEKKQPHPVFVYF